MPERNNGLNSLSCESLNALSRDSFLNVSHLVWSVSKSEKFSNEVFNGKSNYGFFLHQNNNIWTPKRKQVPES